MLKTMVLQALRAADINWRVSDLVWIDLPKRTFQNEIVRKRRQCVTIDGDNYAITITESGKFRTYQKKNGEWQIRSQLPRQLRPALVDLIDGVAWDRLKQQEQKFNPYPRKSIRKDPQPNVSLN
jgi:hypothetical protein